MFYLQPIGQAFLKYGFVDVCHNTLLNYNKENQCTVHLPL